MIDYDEQLYCASREALSKIASVAAELLLYRLSDDIDDWQLPKGTPMRVARKILQEAERHNEANRRRAVELKIAFDVLSKLLK